MVRRQRGGGRLFRDGRAKKRVGRAPSSQKAAGEAAAVEAAAVEALASPEVDDEGLGAGVETLADLFSAEVPLREQQKHGASDSAAGDGGDLAAEVYRRGKSLPPIMNQEKTSHTKAKKRELFTHISLAMDKETAKYMPYSAVAFPKLAGVDGGSSGAEKLGGGGGGGGGSSSSNRTTNSNNNNYEEEEEGEGGKSRAELESMWMIGFLDHERRNEKDAALKDLGKYMSMPGGQLLAGVGKQMRGVYRKSDKDQAAKERRLSKMTAGQRRRVLGSSTVAARLSDDHVLRLKHLERTKGGSDEAVLGTGSSRAARKQAARRRKACMTVYKRENSKIRRAVRDKAKRNAAQAAPQTVMRSRAMEDLFELERDRLAAVLKVQECWRTYKARGFWRDIVAKSRAVTKIQRCVRGMLARSLVRVWLLRRSWLVIVAQAVIRGFLSRKRSKQRLHEQQASVTRLQSAVRGYLARIRADYQRSWRAAGAIQRRWRGCVARVRADRLWLDREVSKMQKIVRGRLGRLRFIALQQEATAAAEVLQRNTRAMFGKWRRNEKMWQRETERRQEFLRVLRSEDEYFCEVRDELLVEMNELLEVDTAVAFARTQWEAMQDQVNEKEFDLLAMEHERSVVDRRAIEQGWTTELDKFVDEHRTWVTNAKTEALFVGAFYLRSLEQRQAEMQDRLAELEWRIAEIRRLREEEAEELYARERQHHWEQERRERRRKVADQRRRWQVRWYTDDGKADKRRRPGYAWDPSSFAGPERETFNVGSVNLLAGADGEDVSGLELISQKVALQNAQNQIVQYGSLLKPLFDGMESMTEAVAQLSLRNEMEREMREAMAAEAKQLDEQAEAADDGDDFDIEQYV